MSEKIRAKFKCLSVARHEASPGGVNLIVSLGAVYGKDGSDNAQWSKWTPNGTLSMTITNPVVDGFFEPGREYFIDLTPAAAPVTP